jgi:hypothetical protein
MRVSGRRRNVLVAQNLCNRERVNSSLSHPGRRMPQIVESKVLDPGFLTGPGERRFDFINGLACLRPNNSTTLHF